MKVFRYNSNNSMNVANSIRNRREKLRQIFGSKCCICGYDKVQTALEFHHINPAEKKFAISQSDSVTASLEDQLKEVRKCILVCANCHRGIHQGQVAVPANWHSLFNEGIAQEIWTEHQALMSKTRHYCQRCGKEITRWADKYCTDCGHYMQRRCERPDRDTLKELIRTTPFVTIGSAYGVTDNAVRKWCDFYNLPRKKAEINRYSDREWEDV